MRKVYLVHIYYWGKHSSTHSFETFADALKFYTDKKMALKLGSGPMWVVSYPQEVEKPS